ncbi:hypothetical protein P692DRAFT_20676870, partial [Suillus brevipes Sb2]
FQGVEAREYDALQHVLEETGQARARLFYDYSKRVLLVDMPGALHEALFTKLKLSLASSLEHIPYDHKLISSTLEMNSTLEINDKSYTPDIFVSMTKGNGASKELLLPLFGECVCSETLNHALEKIKETIGVHPEIDMIIIGIVREVNAYHSPKEDSLASKTFLQLPTPIPRDQFIPERSTPCEPVNVAGHTWCDLRSAEFLIWVKQDGEAQIDLSNQDAEHMAHGTLFPVINMDAATNMIQRGLKKIKDSFIAYTKHLDGTADITRMKEAKVGFSIDWEDSVRAFNTAVASALYSRYSNW